jgi:single-strand DNA-binding protein
MAIYQNKIFLIGYAGSNPDTHTFEDGGMVTNLSLATTRYWKKKGSEEFGEETTWHRLVFRGGDAVKAYDWLRKGSRVSIEGYIKSRTVGEGDSKKYYTDVIVEKWINLDPRSQEEAQAGYRQPKDPVQSSEHTPIKENLKPLDEEDDDLPFSSSLSVLD